MTKKPSPAEIEVVLQRALEAWDTPLPDLDIDSSIIDIDLDAIVYSPSLECASKAPLSSSYSKKSTQKISLRVPEHVLNAFKQRAKMTGKKYQSLMNRALITALEEH